MQLLAYRPFLDPLPVWSAWGIYLLIVPLCLAIAVVYKAMKCGTMNRVPIESGQIMLWIIGGFSGAALALMLLVKWLA